MSVATINKKAPPELPAATHPTPLWRHRDYLLLWSGQAVSSVGSEASQLVLPLLILSLTQSPAQAGFAGALRALAYLLLGLPAGALVDRWDRKRTMILCDAARALALGSIPLALALDRLTILQLYLVSVLEGAVFVFPRRARWRAPPRGRGPAKPPRRNGAERDHRRRGHAGGSLARRSALRCDPRAAVPTGRYLLRRLSALAVLDSSAFPGRAPT